MNEKRVFIAVNLPAQVRADIYELLSKNIPKGKCKIVEKENLHITMKFLGYLNDEKIEEVKNAIDKLKAKPFEAIIEGLGHFNGRVIWLGVEQGGNELIEISNQLNNLLEIQDERFHPHITVARNKEMRRKEIDELIHSLNEKKYSAKIFVDRIDLMLSNLTPKGSIYSKLYQKTF